MDDEDLKNGFDGLEKRLSEVESNGLRSERDLDSITIGSPTKGQAKIYFNWRVDNVDDVKMKLIDMLNAARAADLVVEK